MEATKPKSLGYYMPAEWAKHSSTWLSWPKNPLTFPNGILESVETIYCKMVAALSFGEKVNILFDDQKTWKRVAWMLEKEEIHQKNIFFYPIKSVDVWIRDYGPTFLIQQHTEKRAVVKWNFNAWGRKYEDSLYDDITGKKIAEAAHLPIFTPGIVMEGGAIEVNGEGIVMTTEECLLHTNRNPKLSREEIEWYLREYLNVAKIIWLKSGIAGDDTDGHVDDFARFAPNNTILCCDSDDPSDENHPILKQNIDILRNSSNVHGKKFNIVLLPMPRIIVDYEEQCRLPASYANFYIGNKVVLVPIFEDKNDDEALNIIKSCYPDRRIIPIVATDLVYGYGGIHCVTQQEPT